MSHTSHTRRPQSTPIIIPAALTHIDEIYAIEQASFPKSDAWSRASIEREIAHENSMCHVALLDETPVGFAVLRQMINEGYLFSIVVGSAHRKRGIGCALAKTLEARARERSLIGISLDVRAKNAPAIAMYAKLGYEIVGRNKNYYQHPDEDGIVMWKSLSYDTRTDPQEDM